MGAFGRFFMGRPGRTEQISTMSPQQAALTNQLAQQGMQNTDFSGIENLETKRFNEQTIPSIMSRFMAHGQNQNSSAMQAALGGAGADLGARLAALRSQYGLQQSQLGLTPQFENVYNPGSEGILSQIAGPLANMGMSFATGGLIGSGAFGRGMMDQYRGRPSSGSAYQNLFANRQLRQPMGYGQIPMMNQFGLMNPYQG